MDTRAEFLQKIKEYNPNYDMKIIADAFDLATKMHRGQLRKSGEPYMVHPIAVDYILADMGMDSTVLVAGLLHDVVEDTEYSSEDLERDFGEDVKILVDGVTKLGSIKFDTKEEAQAENLRKMLLAMSKDIRVLIIKLADRLHNMRTAQYWTPEKQKEKSKETLDIYAPLASRLGIFAIKFELEDIALSYLHPKEYEELKQKVATKTEQRNKLIESVINSIKVSLDKLGIKYDISGRSKHLYSVYKKMTIQKKNLDEIFDLTAVRVIVETVKDCYAVLGQVHTMWKPIPGRFKDYIAMPKPNMYQSLHTTLLGNTGEPFEVQIRTYEMHRVAEFGIAAHWKYKEGNTSGKENPDDIKLAWLRQTLEWQKYFNDPKEFMDNLRMDLFASQVFVFTPEGAVIELPAKATPLDFAFKIHTEVGEKCVGAKVNGKMTTIDHTLNNGDIVEIVTSQNANGPSPDWLNIVKSSTARSKIRQYLRKVTKLQGADRGREALEKYIKKKGFDVMKLTKASFMNKAIKEINQGTLEELYVQMSKSSPAVSKFASLLFKYYDEEINSATKKSEEKNDALKEQRDDGKTRERQKQYEQRRNNPGIIVKGVDNLMIRIARCCNPVPGDEIIGFITKGRGISVHRCDCTNMVSLSEEDKGRLIEVEWQDLEIGKSYLADVCIISIDRKGILPDISRACEDMDVHISGVNAKSDREGHINTTLTLSIAGMHEMQKLLRKLRNVDGVLNVYRAKS